MRGPGSYLVRLSEDWYSVLRGRRGSGQSSLKQSEIILVTDEKSMFEALQFGALGG
jgi:hypothetical protein